MLLIDGISTHTSTHISVICLLISTSQPCDNKNGAQGSWTKTTKGKHKKIDESADVNNSVLDQTNIDDYSNDIKDMKDELKNILKNSDAEELIRRTVTEVVKSQEMRMLEEIKQQIQEKCKKLEGDIRSLEFENSKLKGELENKTTVKEKKTKEIETRIDENDRKARDAIIMGNCNEQYSRKNYVKILNIEKEQLENKDILTKKVCSILNPFPKNKF